MNASGAFFVLASGGQPAKKQSRIAPRRAAGAASKRCPAADVMLLPLRFPCGCVVTLAGWPNRSLAKNGPHSQWRPVRPKTRV
ncbi:MAG: hypothetical protein H0Z34_17305 [Brevibacillus sp.]|nr:hypothetical protein [Brevibacillus sp.]